MTDLIDLFATTQMQWIVILIIIDIFLGIIAALVKREFAFSKLCNFMKWPVIGYVFGFAVIEMVGQAIPFLSWFVPTTFVLIVIVLLASIFGNLGKLGVPLPGSLKK